MPYSTAVMSSLAMNKWEGRSASRYAVAGKNGLGWRRCDLWKQDIKAKLPGAHVNRPSSESQDELTSHGPHVAVDLPTPHTIMNSR